MAEFGGKGCVAQIIAGTREALRGADIARQWYFPSVGQYAPLLEEHGFEVRLATLFDRPTPLEDGEQGLRNWLWMFVGGYLDSLEPARREEVLTDIERRLRGELWHKDHWVADYRRIRLVAVKL